MVKHFRVDEILQAEHRDEYEKLLRDPSSTNESLHNFLVAKGGSITRSAVGAHRRAFLTELKEIQSASRMAHAFAGVVRKEGAANITEAAQARYEQLFMQSLFEIKPGDPLAPRDWKDLSQVIKTLVTSRREAEQLHEASKKDARPDEKKPKDDTGDNTAGPELVARMNRILGLDG